MSAVVATRPSDSLASTPPLENGDRLTRAEFERRYAAMPEVKKAELIEGTVFMPSPAHFKQHGRPHQLMATWLGTYEVHTPGVEGGIDATVRLDEDNEPQPDCFLRVLPELGGQTQNSPDDYVEGPPELAVEVAASSASYDLHQKKDAFRRNGVREYLVWVVRERRVEWWELREGVYQPIVPSPDGSLRSRVFPGLWLDAPAVLRGELARVLALVGDGVKSQEHAAFAAQLAARHPPA